MMRGLLRILVPGLALLDALAVNISYASEHSEKFVREFDCDAFSAEYVKYAKGLFTDIPPDVESVAQDCAVAKGGTQRGYKNIGFARFRMAKHSAAVETRSYEEERWLFCNDQLE